MPDTVSISSDKPQVGGGPQKVSIIVPCRNEQTFIENCLRSILAFEVPDGWEVEIFVVDGDSDDETPSIVDRITAESSNVKRLRNPDRIQSSAMNIGIQEATGEYIMRLDAHSIYPINYLRLCLDTAIRTHAENVGGIVITEAGDHTYSANLVQALTTHKFGVGGSGFRVGMAEGPADTVPFGFFRADIFNRIGLFEVRLVRAQDYEFNQRIRANGGLIWLNPLIRIRYFNQKTLTAFYRKQAVLEAPYNAYMWYVAPKAFALRHAITALFVLGVVVGGALSVYITWVRMIYFSVLVLYVTLAVGASVQQAIRYRKLAHCVALPPCFALYHVVHGLGILWGCALLAVGRAPVQKG